MPPTVDPRLSSRLPTERMHHEQLFGLLREPREQRCEPRAAVVSERKSPPPPNEPLCGGTRGGAEPLCGSTQSLSSRTEELGGELRPPG